MEQQEHHEMQLEKVHPSGAEEWYCPECGRNLILRWLPTFKKIVLDSGNELMRHSATKGGLRLTSVQVTDDAGAAHADEGLALWSKWIDEMNLDNWPNQDASIDPD